MFKISCNDEIELEESGETVFDDQTCFHTVVGSHLRKLEENTTREETKVTAGHIDFEGNTTRNSHHSAVMNSKTVKPQIMFLAFLTINIFVEYIAG